MKTTSASSSSRHALNWLPAASNCSPPWCSWGSIGLWSPMERFRPKSCTTFRRATTPAVNAPQPPWITSAISRATCSGQEGDYENKYEGGEPQGKQDTDSYDHRDGNYYAQG